jgi:hypothetical protein
MIKTILFSVIILLSALSLQAQKKEHYTISNSSEVMVELNCIGETEFP